MIGLFASGGRLSGRRSSVAMRTQRLPGSRHSQCTVCRAQAGRTASGLMRSRSGIWQLRGRLLFEHAERRLRRFLTLFCGSCGLGPRAVMFNRSASSLHPRRRAAARQSGDSSRMIGACTISRVPAAGRWGEPCEALRALILRGRRLARANARSQRLKPNRACEAR